MSLQYIGLVDFYPATNSNHKTVKLNSMHVQFCSILYAKLCSYVHTCTANTLNDITIATLVKCLIIKETLWLTYLLYSYEWFALATNFMAYEIATV